MLQLPTRTRLRDKIRIRLGRNHSSIDSQPNTDMLNLENIATTTPPTERLPTIIQPPSCNLSSSVQTSALSHSVTPPCHNLWLEALHKLSKEDQESLSKILPTQELVSNQIDKLVATIKIKQTEYQSKSYKFSIQGREIILTNVAEKIVSWLNKFKEVGDIATNFDPIHASLPWAAIRFTLQAAVTWHEQMGALLVSMEKVTHLIKRCKIYETLYKPGIVSEEVLQLFHTGLIELYAAILRILTLCHRLFSQKMARRVGHAFVNPNEIADFLTKVQDLENRVETEVDNCERDRCQEADSIAQDLEILDWMSQVLYGYHHTGIRDMRTKDTCDWLLQHNRYREWQNGSTSTILWLHGRPGTGKTYLTSRVIDEFQGSLRTNPSHESLAFFYCNRNEIERQKPLSVLRSFVRQLSIVAYEKGSIQKRLKDFYLQSRLSSSEPTLNDCKDLLLGYINIYPKTTLVLDALDECDKHERGRLVEIFDYLLANALRPLKIFISSRPDGDIKNRFSDGSNIEIRITDTNDDIAKFIQSEITKHQKWNKMPIVLKKEIIVTLQDQSQGMFQWAYLQIKQLLGLSQAKHIRDRLGKLPKDLKNAYDEICNTMSDYERRIAYRAFRWIMCCCVPLPTKVILPAVSQDEDDDAPKNVEDLDADLLLEYCHHLLVIDHSRGVWVPSHLSVIEYFENHVWTQIQANCLVSSVCLLILNDTNIYTRDLVWGESDLQMFSKEYLVSDQQDDQGLQSLIVYAGNFWMTHVRRSQGEYTDVRLITLLKQFLGSPASSSHAYQTWHEIICRTPSHNLPESCILNAIQFCNSTTLKPEDLAPALKTAFPVCYFGFDTILSDWWDSAGPELGQKTQNGRTLLELAIYGRSVSICKRLLNWGVDVNEHVRNCGSALATASMLGEKEIVELLIEAKASVNMHLPGEFGSALAAGVEGAANGTPEIIALLLEAGAEVNMQLQTGYFGSALTAAAVCDRLDIINLLLNVGANVNLRLQAGYYGSVLAAAVEWDRLEIIKRLLEAGAEVNLQLQIGKYGSALATAVEWDRLEIVKLLLEAGASVDMPLEVGEYGSALAAAARCTELGIVRILLEAEADVNLRLQTCSYGSALATAAAQGAREVVKLLLEAGAEVNIQLEAGDYGSVLAAATRSNDPGIVCLLLEAGAEVEMLLQTGKYRSALAASKRLKRGRVTKFLLEYGAVDESDAEQLA